MKSEILENLQNINNITSEMRIRTNKETQKKLFETVAYAGFFKALDYILEIYLKKETPNESIFLISGLRGICEDLIYIKAISAWPEKDANEYIAMKLQLEYKKSMEAQSNFFQKQNLRLQYLASEALASEVLPPEMLSPKWTKLTDFKLASFWRKQKYGNKKDQLPSVFHIADKVHLKFLYNFLYHGTSESVHHNLRYLFRMGWGESSNENERSIKFELGVKNYSDYYFVFCQFYGIYLLYLYYENLGSMLKIKKCISKEINFLYNTNKKEMRWPELVTYEELNKKRISVMGLALLHSLKK